MPSDNAAASEFILANLGELVDYVEDQDGLRIETSYYYITNDGVDALRIRRMLDGFKGQLRLRR